MNLKEYKDKINKDEEWAPGIEAIENTFNKVYSSSTHILRELHASIGGNDYLYGTNIYSNDNYNHIVSLGMSELYADEKLVGKEKSGHGYEFTMKYGNSNKEVYDAITNFVLHHFARYVYLNNAKLEPDHTIICNVEDKLNSLGIKAKSNIGAFVLVKDKTMNSIDTPHGKVDFYQLVGLTKDELEMVREESWVAFLIASKLGDNDPNLLFNLERESYTWDTLADEE